MGSTASSLAGQESGAPRRHEGIKAESVDSGPGPAADRRAGFETPEAPTSLGGHVLPVEDPNIERAMWADDRDTRDDLAGCVCCCGEHTSAGCPAREWYGCRGSFSDYGQSQEYIDAKEAEMAKHQRYTQNSDEVWRWWYGERGSKTGRTFSTGNPPQPYTEYGYSGHDIDVALSLGQTPPIGGARG